MKRVELYANDATQVIVNVPNLSQEEYDERVDEIFGELTELDYDIDDITDTYLNLEENTANFYLLNGKEIKVLEFNIKNSEPEMCVGEYIVFTDLMADRFNERDLFGNKDFSEGDEIKVGGISHIFGEPHTVRYRLETYLVSSQPVVITMEDLIARGLI